MELALDQEVGLDEGYGVPEDDHIAVMFKALDDSHEQSLAGVTGEENLSLAQVYAAGVLSNYSSGRVAGNESVFSSIGEGFKKVWDYIKGMFKNLWGFFFKKETADKAEEKAEEVDKEAKELEDRVNGNVSEEEANKAIKETLSAAKLDGQEIKINNMTHSEFLSSLKNADKKEIQKAMVELVSDLKKRGSDNFKKLQKTANQLRTNNNNTKGKVNKAFRLLDNTKKLTDKQKSVYKELKSDVEQYLKASGVLVDQIVGLTQTSEKSFTSVMAMMNAVSKFFRENGRIIKRFSNVEHNAKGLIAELEKKVQANTDNAEEASDTKAEIEGLRDLMRMSATVASSVKGNVNTLNAVKENYKAIFGYK